MVRTEYDYAIFPHHFKKVHTENCSMIKKIKLQESKDERRARLYEKI